MRTGRANGPTSKSRRSQGVRAKPTSRSPTEIDKLVGRNVRRVRLERGLTLSDLGEQLGISHQQLQKYETGTNRLSAGMLCALAEVLEVRIESLFNDASAKSRGIEARADARIKINCGCPYLAFSQLPNP